MSQSAMKKSAKFSGIKSKNIHFPFIKLISGIILSVISYFLFTKFKYTDPLSLSLSLSFSFDLNPILPPNGSILESIAIPRVSGSSGNAKVREFIKSQFSSNLWEIEEDLHVIPSPHGKSTKFVNLIITRKTKNALDPRRLILAAHYDSKLLEAEGNESFDTLRESEFIGASDSAFSCALIIAIARAIQGHRNLKQNFQLIFFDGEEAVHNWTPTDSLYGSRALANKWSKLPKDSFDSLDKINLMVLLDLIGTEDGNNFYSFYPEDTVVDGEFKELIRLENEDLNTDKTKNIIKSHKYFQESNEFKSYNGQAIEDDHTPFLPFNVPVLHLIPMPFPSVWHTPGDTIEALDRKACEKLSKIIYKFIRNKLII
jgi:glutaminyl-peptide cyclotransferase